MVEGYSRVSLGDISVWWVLGVMLALRSGFVVEKMAQQGILPAEADADSFSEPGICEPAVLALSMTLSIALFLPRFPFSPPNLRTCT